MEYTYITYTDCDIHAMHVGQKRSRCGHCTGCQRDNCGQFKYCKDMPQYGGSGKKRQCCIERNCLNISSNNAGKLRNTCVYPACTILHGALCIILCLLLCHIATHDKVTDQKALFHIHTQLGGMFATCPHAAHT